MSHFALKDPYFVKTCLKSDQYPSLVLDSGKEMVEIAVCGRSNVGKSSLLNYLFQRKNLAKTSATPGKTQAINFFVADEILSIVDLPGYGYAKVPEAMRRSWGPMVQQYLEKRKQLALVLFLFDIRRMPTEEDFQMLDWIISRDLAALLVFTKVDKLGAAAVQSNTHKILKAFGAENLHYVHTSSEKRVGRKKLLSLVNEALSTEEEPT